ncbi:MAG: hypothetical protein ACYDDF_05195 [Thermoplasmatota archaeon]
MSDSTPTLLFDGLRTSDPEKHGGDALPFSTVAGSFPVAPTTAKAYIMWITDFAETG